MKKKKFFSQILSLCLLSVVISACSHRKGSPDGVMRVGGGSGNILKNVTPAKGSANCDILKTVEDILNEQAKLAHSSVSNTVLGQFALGIDDKNMTQIVAVFDLTDSTQSRQSYLSSVMVDQDSCSVNSMATSLLKNQIDSSGSCDFEKQANDYSIETLSNTVNPSEVNGVTETETLIKDYIVGDSKNSLLPSLYSAKLNHPVVELYRIFKKESDSKLFGVMFLLNRESCGVERDQIVRKSLLPRDMVKIDSGPPTTKTKSLHLQKRVKDKTVVP